MALGRILQLNKKHQHDLMQALQNLASMELNNGVRKQYEEAIKKYKLSNNL